MHLSRAKLVRPTLADEVRGGSEACYTSFLPLLARRFKPAFAADGLLPGTFPPLYCLNKAPYFLYFAKKCKVLKSYPLDCLNLNQHCHSIVLLIAFKRV
ncbi:MAG: hypothetical protein ACXWBH_14165, partial [Candidatus Angelobacter sp.]